MQRMPASIFAAAIMFAMLPNLADAIGESETQSVQGSGLMLSKYRAQGSNSFTPQPDPPGTRFLGGRGTKSLGGPDTKGATRKAK